MADLGAIAKLSPNNIQFSGISGFTASSKKTTIHGYPTTVVDSTDHIQFSGISGFTASSKKTTIHGYPTTVVDSTDHIQFSKFVPRVNGAVISSQYIYDPSYKLTGTVLGENREFAKRTIAIIRRSDGNLVWRGYSNEVTGQYEAWIQPNTEFDIIALDDSSGFQLNDLVVRLKT